ncbi:MAG: tRNA (adenosine(37)-N6)-threonylcarbamoyltransferase complex ATPase subunit type 1 TsaE [Deltaproteobacteria bacterium]|nr:tRNA (adenosine(37)-N6)-threonylcarbamoyltransferase complex ATPase subunit type 1 TsaE [Deltaproteobacteria bacterium]
MNASDRRLRRTTTSPAETRALAAEIANHLVPGTVIALHGPLGAGKTCFVQGLARALEVSSTVMVTSPTYTLLNIYPGRYPVYHFDWYRLDDIDAVWQLDCEEYFEGRGITVVEWGEKFPAVLPPRTIHMTIEIGTGTRRTWEIPASFCLTELP